MLTGLARIAYQARHMIHANSPTLLTAVGVGGTAATAVLTAKATFKAAGIIADKSVIVHEDRTGDDAVEVLHLSKLEKVRLVWPNYIPPVLAGGLTITAIVTANRISSTRIAALVVASGVSERALQEYKDKIVEKLGDKQSTALRDEIAQDRVDKDPPRNTELMIMSDGDVLVKDSITGRYFTSTVEKIRRAENNTNAEMLNFDCASLSFFYDQLDLPPTDISDVMGWNLANKMDITFSSALTPDKKPCLVIEYIRMPSVDYDRMQRG